MDSENSIALVLLNMGGPDSLEAVEPFLFNLFSDRQLIRLPCGALLQRPFARLISRARAPRVRENYRAIGGSSPQRDWTERQAAGVASILGEGVRPYVVMRYWAPRAENTLRRMQDDGVRRAVVLSLYPHYTDATTGSRVDDFRPAAAAVFPDLSYNVIHQWYDWPGYLDALAARVEEGLAAFPPQLRERVQILFSAHALPQKFIDRGDPYLDHVLKTIRGVMRRVGEGYAWQVGSQSRSGPVRWMEPETREMLERLARDGHEEVLMVPVSFVSDHIETLQEIDMEYRSLARRLGIRHFVRCPSLNDSADFLAALAGLTRDRLKK